MHPSEFFRNVPHEKREELADTICGAMWGSEANYAFPEYITPSEKLGISVLSVSLMEAILRGADRAEALATATAIAESYRKLSDIRKAWFHGKAN